MQYLPSTLLLALLFIFSSVLANPTRPAKVPFTEPIHKRDATISCAEYASIANLSSISANSTIRAAYLQASPLGTDPTRAPLDQAELKEPSLIFDAELNTRCGNLTTIALAAVNTNFSMGVVGPFQVNAAGRAVGSVSLAALVSVILVAGLLL
ncbi:hypothetical protein BJ878DRAFT_129254 [Calycina marina]|uniref:Uncharacterized protein n=1 Tax=Calycina marina TaxID=1763456 RepID=A0A9P7Z9L8_9HELO|nr:hypothetical protein BJ878DRAFT_129254 [Calycina marina]